MPSIIRQMGSTCNKCIFNSVNRLLAFYVLPSSYRRISSSVKLEKKNFRSPIKFLNRHGSGVDIVKKFKNSIDIVQEEENNDMDQDSVEIQNLVHQVFGISGSGHNVFVIQPYIKYGPMKPKFTTPQLQLDESVTLINTLRNWKVMGKVLIPVLNFNRQQFFGTGQLDTLKNQLKSNTEITAVFICVNMLLPVQQLYLEDFFGLPIYDRYTIVIHIFREHATTKEAKLQIQRAELPYLWSRLNSMKHGSLKYFGGTSVVLGSKWKGKEYHYFLLKKLESKLKLEIAQLKEHRKNIRKGRTKVEIPVVAVVGYTNCGKTSLIKALTGKETLEPQNYLFATLDVTVHEGTLPSSLKVLYVDTIGFISDIPMDLFESFIATLEDVKIADVIVHVRDISHPDNIAQNENVKNILELLELPEKISNNMITVGNKIDLVQNENLEKFRNEGMILISASKMIGTGYLLEKIEEQVLKATDRKVLIMKVRNGEDEYQWLHENATVVNETACPEDSQYAMMKVILTNTTFAKFKHVFIKEYQKKRGQDLSEL